MVRRAILGAVTGLAAATSAALAGTTPAPTATTATYGAWTVGCAAQVQADGSGAVQVCQMTTQLNLKGQDGQLRPLLQISIGQPAGVKDLRLALQVPVGVALRDGVTISLDLAPAAGADPAAAKPQETLAALRYLTCSAQGCVADTEEAPAFLDRLTKVKSANVGFTLLQGAKKVMVPVSLDGFKDALAALKANGK